MKGRSCRTYGNSQKKFNYHHQSVLDTLFTPYPRAIFHERSNCSTYRKYTKEEKYLTLRISNAFVAETQTQLRSFVGIDYTF